MNALHLDRHFASIGARLRLAYELRRSDGEASSPSPNGALLRRNPGVYVKGRIRHADHATITLPGWHRVVMNTENQSLALRHVAFLD